MEALTISAANLDAIEKNLGAVANELSGVIGNVRDVNDQVNNVEEKVASLNDEVKNLVKEIRETTIITNARQTIMYNNEMIQRRFGYYDQVRRKTESLLDAVLNSQISGEALVNLKHDLLLNNPNYWLSNALAALTSWILDDRSNTEIEVNNAMKKDAKKTSIFFALVNLKLGRNCTALNWLDKYLSMQNPLEIDKDFVTVLDLVAIGEFGSDARLSVLKKIDDWFRRLNVDGEINKRQIDVFTDYIKMYEESDIIMPYLDSRTPDIQVLKNNLSITSSYANVFNSLKEIVYRNKSRKTYEDVLRELIYEYEGQEQIYQKDNLLNNLIIECNGNREEAQRIYEKQEKSYDSKTDLITMLSNIVLYRDSYKVSNETQKIALAYVSKYILEAYELRNSKIDMKKFALSIRGFETSTEDGKNMEQIKADMNKYLHDTYDKEDKDLIIALMIINILGIVGVFVTLNSKILSIILILILVVGNVALFLKMNKRMASRNKAFESAKGLMAADIEKVLAETVDYRNMISDDMNHYSELVSFLKNLNPEDYIAHSDGRNISIGD